MFFIPRLREAVEAKRGVLPRFGSKYRYSGRTLYETRVNTEQRTQPYFERTASKQYINNNRTHSIDDSELTALKGTRDEDPSWAESTENVQVFLCAGFVWWFCQTFCDRSTFFALNLSSSLTLGHGHVSSFFADEDQKRACDIIVQCLTSG